MGSERPQTIGEGTQTGSKKFHLGREAALTFQGLYKLKLAPCPGRARLSLFGVLLRPIGALPMLGTSALVWGPLKPVLGSSVLDLIKLGLNNLEIGF